MFCPHEEVYINHDREAGEQMGNFEGGGQVFIIGRILFQLPLPN